MFGKWRKKWGIHFDKPEPYLIISTHAVERYIERVDPTLDPLRAYTEIRNNIGEATALSTDYRGVRYMLDKHGLVYPIHPRGETAMIVATTLTLKGM